jgi:hypothetical protein
MRAWKLIGLAGIMGVTAGATTVAVRHRRRSWDEADPQALRDRLRARVDAASDDIASDDDADDAGGNARHEQQR